MEEMELRQDVQPEQESAGGGEKATLEELFGELDGILAAMEDPEISLEDSFSLYERGMKTVKSCSERLDTVEKKMLVIARDGSEVPFGD